MGIFDELKERGLVVQATNEKKLSEVLDNEEIKFYIGIDPTGDCPHVGHLVQFMTISRLQEMGHQAVLLFGGATAMIGDPSGKSDIRKMLSSAEISENIKKFTIRSKKYLHGDKLTVVNNADWLKNLNYIDFLRDIGICFSVNKMLACECYKARLERGLTFFEMNYMVMQSYDFLHLFDTLGCTLQFGGNDQWSNILGGVDLIRRKHSTEVFGMTSALLTKSDGQKMGKTEKGALWLDPDRVSPYDFFQYFRNVDDNDVIKCLKMLTRLPMEQISEFEILRGKDINAVKEVLAFEVTKLVHGESEANKAANAAKSVFYEKSAADIPEVVLKKSDFADNQIDIVTLLVKSGLAKSRGDAKRNVEQGGISVCNEKMSDCKKNFGINDFSEKDFVIQKGKKLYKKIKIDSNFDEK